jgi:pimeloyl-ACP methyl ester carboxylesterase
MEYRELDVDLGEGRRLHAYDTGGDDRLAVVWHHGTPNIGAPPEPLFAAADRLGIRWVAYDRPGYGGSTPRPDRSIGSAADDVRAVVDHLGIERFAVMGHSGGSTHALASGARLSDRVTGVASMAALAPHGAEGLDYFAGMCPSGVASLTAAAQGRAVKEHQNATADEYDPEFNERDIAMFDGPWGWFGSVVGPALEAGPAPLIDDDLAYTGPWGFDVAEVTVPVLLLHGTADRIVPSGHGEWLAGHLPDAELRLLPGEGHISVVKGGEDALEWLRTRAKAA